MTSTRDFARGPPFPDVGVLSRLAFEWVTPLIRKGFRQPLQAGDVWDTRDRNRVDRFSKHFDAALDTALAESGGRPPSPFRILWLAERGAISYTLFIHLTDSIGQILRPIFLGFVISSLDPSVPLSDGVMYAVGLLLASIVVAIAHSHYTWECRAELGIRVQGGFSSLVVKKSLRVADTDAPQAATQSVSRSSRGQGGASGEHASESNLVSTDALIMLEALYWGLRVPGYALVTVASIALLVAFLGAATLAGLAVLVVSMFLQWLMGRRQSLEQESKQRYTDGRLRHLKEAVTGIHAVKYHGWERGVSARVTALREKELVHVRRFRFFWAVNECLSSSTIVLVALASLSVHAVQRDGVLDPTTVFTSLALFNLLREPVQFVPLIASATIKGVISAKRIARYLALPELTPQNRSHTETPEASISTGDDGPAAADSGTGFTWHPGIAPALHSATFRLPRPDALVAVVGPVGAGKSTLLASLLGETYAAGAAPTVTLRGSVAYAPQQAWVMNATVRENVVATQAWDEARYRRVIRACSLDKDVAEMDANDLTELGEHGRTISGGQMQRISLARAAYADAQIALLDDPLSALDQPVARKVFDDCICTVMAGRARLLVTHYLHLLPRADHIVLMRGGRIEDQGSLTDLNARGIDVASFVEEESHMDTLSDAVSPAVEEEEATPKAGGEESKEEEEFAATASPADVIPGLDSPADEGTKTSTDTPAAPFKAGQEPRKGRADGAVVSAEQSGEGALGSAVYRAYASAFGGVPIVGGAALAFVFIEASYALTDWWLAQWSGGFSTSMQTRLGVYAGLALSNAVFTFIRALFFAHGTVRAVGVLHESVLHAVLRAPVRFFDENPSGRIVNRFAGDVGELEDILPHMLEHSFLCLFKFLMIIVVTSVVIPWYLLVVPPLFSIFFVVMQYYRRSMRELARLYSTSKSPMFAVFGEIIDGRTSIRGYGHQHRFIDRWHTRFNLYGRMAYALFASSVWQHFRLHLVGSFLSFGAALLAVFVRDIVGKALGGYVINFSLVLTFYMTGFVWLSTEAEARLTAVERMSYFAKTKPEAAEEVPENDPADPAWPAEGRVQVQDLVLRYRADLPPALRGVSLDLEPGVRCGVVGRTGAGKSTLSSALFRMVEPEGGRILVDGVNILDIGLRPLRTRLTIIPQVPHLFAGSLRFNLDPEGVHYDSVLLEALEKAGLSDFVRDSPLGLSWPVAELGSNLSVGQRQLLCMARALVRNSRVVVLDEATASLDLETDDQIQRVVSSNFQDATMIIVAHRLQTVIGCDLIAVMDSGRIAEVGPPHQLLQNSDGLLSRLVDATGPGTARELRAQAARAQP